MSDQQSNERRVTVTIASDGCSTTVDNYLSGTEQVRVSFNPAYTMHFDNGLAPDRDVPATVTARFGSTSLTLTPEAWAKIAAAVQQVLPAEVTP